MRGDLKGGGSRCAGMLSFIFPLSTCYLTSGGGGVLIAQRAQYSGRQSRTNNYQLEPYRQAITIP